MDSSRHAARDLLEYLHIGYPIFVLVVFIAAFIASSVLVAKDSSNETLQVKIGPGGRPLPARSRSTMTVAKTAQTYTRGTVMLFRWLTLVVLLTFLADAAINVSHAIIARSEHWWCGQSVVVGSSCPSRKIHC